MERVKGTEADLFFTVKTDEMSEMSVQNRLPKSNLI